MAEPTFDNEYDCIVLGAGIAGLTAARDLQRNGYGVLVLEGAERIGGRMYSVRDFLRDPEGPDRFIPIEAGAEYIHIADSKRYAAFWQEIEHHGFTTSEFHKLGWPLAFDEPRNRVFFPGWDGSKTAVETMLDPEVNEVLDLLYDVRTFDAEAWRDLPAGAYAHSKRYEHTKAHQMADYTLSAHTPGLLDNPPGGTPEHGGNAHDTISVAGISADNIPNQLLESAEFRMELSDEGWPEKICGYDTLPRRILAEFQHLGGTLKTSTTAGHECKVVRVERPGGAIQVTTQAGETFQAKAAICTFSVGMLDPEAGEGDAIFGPLLTEQKRRALQICKMGPITKFSLQFKERLWDDGSPWAGQMSVLSNPAGGARTFFSAFPDRKNGPHVLTGLLMSKDHRKIKDMSDDDAVRHLLKVLHDVFDPGGADWTPDNVLVQTDDGSGKVGAAFRRQDWEEDPFAKGGNSYLQFTPEQRRPMKITAVREALKNPIETLPLFWAGEATAPAYNPDYAPLSVHGAYVSGMEVAADVHHYLGAVDTDPERFARYYTKKYTGRKRTRSFFEWLLDTLLGEKLSEYYRRRHVRRCRKKAAKLARQREARRSRTG